VILISRNNEADVRGSLESIEAATDRNTIETLLVDSGSRDGCSQLDADFPSLHLHRLPRNFGAVRALNIAMRTARGDYFLILEPPAKVAPHTVSRLAALLEAESGAAAVCPLSVHPDGLPATRLHPLPLPDELRRACSQGDFSDWKPAPNEPGPIEVDFINPPVIMVRASFLKGLRFLDQRFGQHWWDLEICTQIRRAGKKILLLPAVQVTLPPQERPQSIPSGARSLAAADRYACAALWVGKHYGAWQGAKFRLLSVCGCAGRALLSLLTFQEPGFHIALFASLLSGQKIDGSQRAL